MSKQPIPYRWDYTIRIKTKEGSYDYEEETKEKVKVLKRPNTGVLYAIRNLKTKKR